MCHCPHQNKQAHDSQPLANSISVVVPQDPEDCPVCAASLKERTRTVGETADGEEEEEEEEPVKDNDRENPSQEHEVGESKRRRSCFGLCIAIWKDMRRKLWGIVESKYFSRGIMIAILINTISMGIEHHNQVRAYTYKLN